jgi:YesN/AraC family two-component response regulator
VFWFIPYYNARTVVTGVLRGPSDEIQRVRLEQSKKILRETTLNLDEITEMTGYHSGHYLSKIFKEKTGMTIRKYRNSLHH